MGSRPEGGGQPQGLPLRVCLVGVFVCPLGVAVCCRAFRGEGPAARVFGPVGTGPRLERRSLYKGLGSFPLHRRSLDWKRTTPERGQMLRRAV